jgi:hypothetical protein
VTESALGDTELQFRSRRFTGAAATGARETVRQTAVTDMVMVVGVAPLLLGGVGSSEASASNCSTLFDETGVWFG